MKLKVHIFRLILISIVMSLCLTYAGDYTSTTISYDSSEAIFANPERGFYAYRSVPISSSFLHSLRNSNVTIVQRIYIIPHFVNDTLSSSFLETMSNDFQTAREGGAKLVLRFSYTNQIDGEDAPLDRVLYHINQIEPLLRENYNVIVYMDAGFIGAWGEWYYSTNNLNNTEDQRTVLFALLDALPMDRMVLVRTPEYKRQIYDYFDPLIPEEAFNGTKRARTGAHNDCFLAGPWDYGTYIDIEEDKTFLNLDNRYVPQGGETCHPSEFSVCSNALIDLERLHWSVLNKDYHPVVLQSWEDDGCMNEVKRRLGYRFRLLNAVIQDSVPPSGAFHTNFSIVNNGWASPFNPRNLEIILRNSEGSDDFYWLKIDEDPRLWMPGDTAHVSIEAGIPDDMPIGSYDILLNFPDPAPALHNRSNYSIRLANLNVWEESTGFNSLLYTIIVDTNASGNIYSGDDYFKPMSDLGVVDDKEETFPLTFHLNGNYPNPFNASTRFEFTIEKPGRVKIVIYDCHGKYIDSILNDELVPGTYDTLWSPYNISSGVYIYKIDVDGVSRSGKCVYLK